MKRKFYVALVLLASLLFGASIVLLRSQPPTQTGAAPRKDSALTNEIAVLRAEIERLKTLLPDQAHAMQDVGYHFANLWFAGQKRNWPLAMFYLNETRSHLRWAVRIIPVRKTKAGELDLNGILDGIDKTDGQMLSAIKTAIDREDHRAFTNAYRQTIEGCYLCHKASEKSFLRPQVPTALGKYIINLDPRANWPQ